MFTIECVIKVIGMGFFINKHSYLRDGFNVLDFIIVISGLIGLTLTQKVTYLRAFRFLRPLKTITRFKNMRILVSSIFESFIMVSNVLLFLLFIIILFGILGVTLFNGI